MHHYSATVMQYSFTALKMFWTSLFNPASSPFTSVYLLGQCVCSDVFLAIIFESYTSNRNSRLLVTCLVNIFSYSAAFIFIFLIMSFSEQKFGVIAWCLLFVWEPESSPIHWFTYLNACNSLGAKARSQKLIPGLPMDWQLLSGPPLPHLVLH